MKKNEQIGKKIENNSINNHISSSQKRSSSANILI